ncbi:MAG: hypothetical protein WA824_00650 [Candidatus Sulfotelmatobacter sp.]
METKPIAADDVDQQWIAKYRRAIEANNMILVRHPGSAPLKKRITGMFEKVLSGIGRMLERCIRMQSRNVKTAGKHSGQKIDRSKLRPHAVSYGLKVGKSTREKAS